MKYVIKKTGTLIITLLIVSFLSFFAFSVIPGDAARSKLGTEATEEQVEALQKEMGLDKPIVVQYGIWLKNFVTGDMGESYSYSMPVAQMLKEKIPVTIAITLMAFLMILALSVPLGIFTAQHEGGWLDRILMVLNQVVMSVPGFLLGIVITYVFGLVLKWGLCGGFGRFCRVSGVSHSPLRGHSPAQVCHGCENAAKFCHFSDGSGLCADSSGQRKYEKQSDVSSCFKKCPDSGADLLGHDHCGYHCKQYDYRAGFHDSGNGKFADFLHFQSGLSGSTGHYCTDCGFGGCD